jgi:peptidoglycan/LPS O-acetylase OafA/YrhL
MGKRISRLDGLRAVAIIAVFLRHALDVRMLWMGVDIFFILSGFLITGILLDMPRDSFKAFFTQFYERRVRRIGPPYFLLLLVASLLFGTIWIKHWYLYLGLTNYIGYFYKDGGLGALNALWSLGVEEQFYIFWPLVIYFFKPKNLPYFLILIILGAPLLRGLATHWSDAQPWNDSRWFIYKSTPFRMDCLALGAMFTILWRRHGETIKKYGYFALIPTFLTPPLMIYLNKYHSGFSTVDGTIRGNVITLEISLIAAAGVFLWALGGKFTWILTTPPMLFLGRISYSFYLIHETMLLLAPRYIHSRYGIAILAFAGSTLYSTLSWYIIEKPILHGGSRKSKRPEFQAA